MPLTLNGSTGVVTPGFSNTVVTATFNGVTYSWPASTGTAGQYLQIDGSNNLSWQTVSSYGGNFVLCMVQSYGIT